MSDNSRLSERIFESLTSEQREALTRIVEEWVEDGFTTPPYAAAYYDIFEALGIVGHQYDTQRPEE